MTVSYLMCIAVKLGLATPPLAAVANSLNALNAAPSSAARQTRPRA